jgi:beta-lactamase regulating signal transducer with metallopeptidase domain
MFVLRGVAVSFSIFFIIYALLSAMVCISWRSLASSIRNLSSRLRADLLFAARIAPLVLATGSTLVFVIPSFWLLEPRVIAEAIGIHLILLGFCGMAIVLTGILNAGTALRKVWRAVANWSMSGKVMARDPYELFRKVPILRTSAPAPPLITAGILRPQVWLSCAAASALTESELLTALRHEVVHVRRYDNLKKLLLCAITFPGMAGLEHEWREASEMAADEAAVSSQSEALDLAAAVIKLSGVTPLHPAAPLTTALVHSPAEPLSSRVERLIAWNGSRQDWRYGDHWLYGMCSASAAIVLLALTYAGLLVKVHAATEWLVR